MHIKDKNQPPLDCDIAKILASLAKLHFPSDPDEIPQFHEATKERHAPFINALLSDTDIHVEENCIPGPHGDIPLVTLRPASPNSLSAPHPGILFLHGGAMISGDPFMGLDIVIELAKELDAVVISVNYRLAPKHQGLALVEDCYAALAWVGRHVQDLGIDPDRLMVAGGSAGGGLAAGTVLMARDRKEPKLCGQLLSGPMLDDRNTTISAKQFTNENNGSYDTNQNQQAWRFVLGDRVAGEDVSYYVAPARAKDLSRLPPCYIDVGSCEPFRDEAVAYATRMWEYGSQADLHVWGGGCHGFDNAKHLDIAKSAIRTREEWVRKILTKK